MILGRISGKITTTSFTFEVKGKAKKFQYCQVYHPDYDYVLCQVTEIERNEGTIARCVIIGFVDQHGRIRGIRTPFEQGQEVLRADDAFISRIIKLSNKENGAFIGRIEGRNIDVCLDLNRLLTRHIAIMAKTGSGKSYAAGVLIEEIISKGIPIIIIDPHAEYSNLALPNSKERKELEKYFLSPRSFVENLAEFGDPSLKQGIKPLRLNESMPGSELMHIIPTRLSPAQVNVLYSSLKSLRKLTFDSLLAQLEREENYSKYSVINIIDYIRGLGVFSQNPTPSHELVKQGRCSVVNLKGIEPDIQEIIAYKLLSGLFEDRKKGKIPPFFAVIEEAHTFCPERSFGEAKSSKILRTIASEGRKFGLGLCVITQRPARIDKSVLSQCSTQIILKVTNPNDIRAISNSVEGINPDSEKEIINLPIGTAMVTGIVDVPLFVRIRPRVTLHGGDSVDLLGFSADVSHGEDAAGVAAAGEGFIEKSGAFAGQEMLPVIQPKITKKDLMLMSNKPISEIRTMLVPAAMLACVKHNKHFSLLFDLVDGCLVHNDIHYRLPELASLNAQELGFIRELFIRKHILPSDIKDKKTLKSLEKKNLVASSGSVYSLNPEYIFSDLYMKRSLRKLEFRRVSYNSLQNAAYSKQEIIESLASYLKVEDTMDCFIVKYDIEYQVSS